MRLFLEQDGLEGQEELGCPVANLLAELTVNLLTVNQTDFPKPDKTSSHC